MSLTKCRYWLWYLGEPSHRRMHCSEQWRSLHHLHRHHGGSQNSDHKLNLLGLHCSAAICLVSSDWGEHQQQGHHLRWELITRVCWEVGGNNQINNLQEEEAWIATPWTVSYSLMARLSNGRRLDKWGRKEPATPPVSSTPTRLLHT